jgi:hypothetical protein
MREREREREFEFTIDLAAHWGKYLLGAGW